MTNPCHRERPTEVWRSSEYKYINILVYGSLRRLQRLMMTENGYYVAHDDEDVSFCSNIYCAH